MCSRRGFPGFCIDGLSQESHPTAASGQTSVIGLESGRTGLSVLGQILITQAWGSFYICIHLEKWSQFHSIHWDTAKKRCTALGLPWRSCRTPIEETRTSVVLFGLHLLYFPSACAFCAGHVVFSVLHRKLTNFFSVLKRHVKNKRVWRRP